MVGRQRRCGGRCVRRQVASKESESESIVDGLTSKVKKDIKKHNASEPRP